LLDSESRRLRDTMHRELGRQGAPPDLQVPLSTFEDQARRRVSLGLLLSEVVKAQGITPDAGKVREWVESVASSYEEPEQVTKWYYGHEQRLSEVKSLVLEDQVVDWVLDRARVVEDQRTFDAVMKPGQTSSSG
jgi:trigger factor